MDPVTGALISGGVGVLTGLMRQSAEDRTREQQMEIFRQQQAFQREQFDYQRQFNEQQFGFSRDVDARNFARLSGLDAQSQANLLRQEALQREFAQSGIRWKVQDAVAAGLHPLAALGGSGALYAPSAAVFPSGGSGGGGAVSSPGVGHVTPPSLHAGTGLATGLASMGQDVSRALMATRAADEREVAFRKTVQEMQLQNMTLRNDLLMSQIQRLKTNANPPGPTLDPDPSNTADLQLKHDKLAGVTPIVVHGTKVRQDPGMSDARNFEDRYGEGLSDWVFGPYIAWRDFNAHFGILEAAQRKHEENKMILQHDLHEWERHQKRIRTGYPAGRYSEGR